MLDAALGERPATMLRPVPVDLETVRNEDRADLASVAISGRGAFRRFKDVLACWPDELERWYAFSDERQRGRARAWLTAAGYSRRRPERRPST